MLGGHFSFGEPADCQREQVGHFHRRIATCELLRRADANDVISGHRGIECDNTGVNRVWHYGFAAIRNLYLEIPADAEKFASRNQFALDQR